MPDYTPLARLVAAAVGYALETRRDGLRERVASLEGRMRRAERDLEESQHEGPDAPEGEAE